MDGTETVTQTNKTNSTANTAKTSPLFLSLTAPIHVDGQPVGAINIKFTLEQLESELALIQKSFIIMAVLETLSIALLVHFLFQRQIFMPLRQLQKVTHTVAEGDFSNQIPIRHNNELSPLTADFNIMTASLAAKAQAITDLEQLRDDLTSMIVHDMKNPLQIINGYVMLIGDHQYNPLDEKQTAMVSAMKRATDRLLNMVMNLLDIRRLEGDRVQLKRSTMAVNELVDGALTAVTPIAEFHDQRLVSDIAIDLPPLEADRDLLQRVLVNLLTNAIKHSAPGCATTVQAQNKGGSVVIKIIDQGEGILPEYQEHIFEKFTQASKQVQGSKTDTGLGLAFCKLAVEAHGGNIMVESSGVAGAGATFTLSFP